MSDLQTPIKASSDSPSLAVVERESGAKAESAVWWLFNRSYWVFVVVLLVQIAAYYAFVSREISGGYPFANDQAGYLSKSHQIFESMLSRGIFTSLWQGMTSKEPTGMLMPSEAAFLYLLFGVSRAVALSIHLFHWIVLQVVVFATFSRLTRSASWGYYAVGLLLLISSPFQFVGGMFDFRMDFSAACLFGIVCSLVIYTQCSDDRRATWYLAGACVYAICFRHILLVFLGGTFGIFSVVLLIQYMRGTRIERLVVRGPLRNFIIPTFCLSLGGLLMIAAKYQAFYSYYVIGHLIGSENEVRAAEYGVNVIGRYAYYPLSVAQQHLGYPALVVLGGVFVLFLIQAIVLRVGGFKDASTTGSSETGKASMLFVGLLIFITLGVLTANTSKSPVVGSILTAPILLLFALLTRAIVSMARPKTAVHWQRLLMVIPLVVFALGTARTLQSYSGRTSLTLARTQFEQLPRAYRAIGDYLSLFDVANPKFFADRVTDYQTPAAVQVSYYEMTGRTFKVVDPVGGNVVLSNFQPFREFLQDADVAMISENIPFGDAQNPMPTVQMFRDNAAEIRNLVSTRMAKIDEVLINDHVVGVYVKPRAQVEGISGGWITSRGIKIKVLREWLPGKQYLLMKGSTIFTEQLKGQLNASVVDLGSGESLPMRMTLQPTDYTMEVDLRGHSFAPGKWVELELKFDRFFVPRKAGVSPDDRELVVLAPSVIRFERTSALTFTPATQAPNISKPLKR